MPRAALTGPAQVGSVRRGTVLGSNLERGRCRKPAILVSVHLGRRVVLIQSMKTDDLLTAVDTESTPPHPPPQEPLPVTCAVECLPGLVVAPRYALPTGTLGLLADLVLASARAKGGKTEAA